MAITPGGLRVGTSFSGPNVVGVHRYGPRPRPHLLRSSARFCCACAKLVLQSQRLVVVLDRLVLQGFRRRQSTDPLAPSDVEPAVRAVRVALGSLAVTTPLKFSADYKRYTELVEALIEVGRAVLDRGVESSLRVAELDEWKPFREP